MIYSIMFKIFKKLILKHILIPRFLKFAPKVFWIIVFGSLVLKFFLLTNLDNDNFLNNYVFTTPDSYDWIANGINLFKSDEITLRNPGYVIIIKILNELNVLYLLPLLNQLIFGFLLVAIFKLILQVSARKSTAYIIILIMFLNYHLHAFANYLLSDYFAIFLMTVAVYYFFKNKIILSYFFLGLSALFQNFAFFLFPIWILINLIFELKGENYKNLFKIILKKIPQYLVYLLIFINLNFFWFVYKFIRFGNPLYSKIIQFDLLEINFDSFLFYGVVLISIFGLGLIISLLFIIFKFRSVLKNENLFLVLISGIFTLFFWIILYNWNDRRFMLYLIPFYLPFLALGLEEFIRKINIVPKILLYFLIIYPTMLSVGWFFNSSTIPIAPAINLKFEENIDKTNLLNQLYISTPITIEKEGISSKTVLRNIYPTFSEIIINKNYYKNNLSTSFYKYSQIIDLTTNRKEANLCELSDLSFTYELNAVNQIIYGKNVEIEDNSCRE